MVANERAFFVHRRTVQRKRHSSMKTGVYDDRNDYLEEAVPIDVANAMSLFFAQATPMLDSVSNVTSVFVAEEDESVARNATGVLSVMAKVCQKMLDTADLRSRLTSELFIMRVMTATIILYDHVHPNGAFVKSE